MMLDEWAIRWRIPDAALQEFLSMVIWRTTNPVDALESESAVQSCVRLEAAQKGIYLWRNNIGAGKLENGSFVRWGLANDSKAVNSIVKSGDLIGIRKRLIKPEDVGRAIGQFVSRECKRASWAFTGADEEQAQVRWATLINSMGGDAAIVNGTGSL